MALSRIISGVCRKSLLGWILRHHCDVKIQALQSANIALWDVLHSCSREKSMDASIDKTTQAANEFEKFFAQYPSITNVFLMAVLRSRLINGQCFPVCTEAIYSLGMAQKIAV